MLVPYPVARQALMTGRNFDDLARNGRTSQWVTERSRAWLEFWRSETGLDGFYPFIR